MNFKKMLNGAHFAIDDDFEESIHTDIFCECYKIVQQDYTSSILSIVYDNPKFTKNAHGSIEVDPHNIMFWNVSVGLVNDIHMYVDMYKNQPELDILCQYIEEGWDYHGNCLSEAYEIDQPKFHELREYLKDFYEIIDLSLETFLWNNACAIATLYALKNNILPDEYNAHNIIISYSDLVDLFITR